MERVIIYIDGPNLLGAVSETIRKRVWLDPYKLSHCLINKSAQQIKAIYYAETPYTENGFSPEIYQKQQRFFGMIYKQIENKTVIHIRGNYRLDRMKIPQYIVAGLNPNIQRVVASLSWAKPIEKGGDVGLAVRLVRDAFQGNFDHAIIVTEDQDFAPAIRIVLGQAKKVSIAYVNNTSRNAKALRNQCIGAGFIPITRANIEACAL